MEKKHSTKRRPKEEYDKVIEASKTESNMMVISKKFAIPWTTVRQWIKGKRQYLKNQQTSIDSDVKKFIKDNIGINEYSYMLGCYLGDGHIVFIKNKISKRITISTATNTPELIRFQSNILTKFGNKIVVRKRKSNCVDIFTHNPELDKLFPQAGPGKKHDRKIELSDWQKEIINHKYLLLGLFHTDGSATKAYSPKNDNPLRYEFVNVSQDIINIYCECLKKLDINYTVVNKICEHKDDKTALHKASKVMCKQLGSNIMFDLFGTKHAFSTKIFDDFDMSKYDNAKIRFSKIDMDNITAESINIPENLRNVTSDTTITKEFILELKKYYKKYDICEMLKISQPTFQDYCEKFGIVIQKYQKRDSY